MLLRRRPEVSLNTKDTEGTRRAFAVAGFAYSFKSTWVTSSTGSPRNFVPMFFEILG